MFKIKFKKTIFFSTFLLLSATVSTVAVACASAPNPQDYSPKKVNVVPANTPYDVIHNLAFSFEFLNTGGIKYKLDSNGTVVNPNYIGKNQESAYAVFGTGWLFDWKLNSDQPDINGNINWTGYFATNLHVADALLNPDDGEYTPQWLSSPPSINSRIDQTALFNLGKYDNSNGPLSSTNRNTNITYVTIGENAPGINTLPKTQFAANSFIPDKFRGINPDTKYYPYIDFAVLAITVKYNPNPTNRNQIIQNEVWNYWIQPAIQTLKTLYPQNTIDPDLTYQEIFSKTDLTLPVADWGNIYIGGYPYYESVATPYMATIGKYDSSSSGSPVWTINVDKSSNSYKGQPIDLANSSKASGPYTPGGIYNANNSLNFMLNYHGQDYKQYGVGYIITNSNLAGGSSGSMALDNNDKLLGIYYGTLSDSAGNESSIGLLETLILSNASYPNPNLPNLESLYKITPYDLIGWSTANKNITNQTKSYFSSLKSPTYLFSKI